MGHKVNPISLRLGITKNWQSRWFSSKNFSRELCSDIEIRQVLRRRFGKTAGVALVEIVRAEDAVKVIIHTSKPGILIGRSGQGINELKVYLVRNCSTLRNSLTGGPEKKIEIEIMEIRNPNLSAELVAQNIAYQIEK